MSGPIALSEINPSEAVEVLNPDGQGGFVLICEHASNRIPAALNRLGLSDEALSSHIAWDPGARAVAATLSRDLDAPLVAAGMSRLIYDCNRPPHADSAMPARSEATDIPGNAGLDHSARLARTLAVYGPFRDGVADTLDRALAMGRLPRVLTIHSFTPVYLGRRREVDIGILHDSDSRLADAMLQVAAEDDEAATLRICRNEPYGPADGVTHTLALHAVPRGLPNVMIEIRNELLADSKGRDRIAALLGRLARGASAILSRQPALDKAG